MRACNKCGEDLVIGENWTESKKKYSEYICNPCKNKWNKKFYESNPDLRWANHLKTNYGITPDAYNEMFAKQGGCCDICGEHQTEFTRRLCVDHDHETGVVRSLLCGPCNTGIGQFGDDIATVREALNYLIRHSEEE